MALSELEASWQARARELLEAPEDAAYVDLGKMLPKLPTESMGALPSPELIAARARKWIDTNKAALCLAMKQSDNVRLFMTDRGTYDSVNVVVAIAGAIVSRMTNIVVPVPLSVAVIVFRLGLEKVCGKDWTKP